ncbi:DNA glycosylase [Podospora fimiseda]|uniref:DNA-(apurinic or apyrimidinic site) lyase n=1 Tax=Podospora fimiseda TaxID=252190 RepID=A0AAN7BWS3_9PEZI|nr:DNA glycosylase [Podospora fimiseda]
MRPQQLSSEWRKFPLSSAELCINTTLRCGQSFRWRNINDEWHCVLRGRLISLKQDPTHLHYKVTWPKTPEPEDDTVALLRNYFSLSLSVSDLYKEWAASDANFRRRAPAFTGIRILNQDAWEALVAFICSSNNNISRISQMVLKLCLHYGPYVASIEGEPFHDFPNPEALSGSGVEAHLRQLGFGYRAKYIADTARIVSKERPANWLEQLRNPDVTPLGSEGQDHKKVKLEGDPPTYRAAHEALVGLTGVGPKVSDCVCLMGLGWWQTVPIDTHVWQIAQRDYSFGKGNKSKTMSKAMYDAVGQYFMKIWGPYAGWAQAVLFTANLKSFAEQAKGKKVELKEETVVKTEVEEEVANGDGETNTVVKIETEETKAVITKVSKKRKANIKVEEENITIDTVVEEVSSTRRQSKRIKSRS